MVIAFVLGGFMFNADASGMEEPQYESVVIRAGDTIWNIAETYGPAEGDTRVYVRKICNANKIDPGKIYPGQTILVPVYADSQKA
jgi:nucleoid-associated protein YgaU